MRSGLFSGLGLSEIAGNTLRSWLKKRAGATPSEEASQAEPQHERAGERTGIDRPPDLAVACVNDWVASGKPRQKPIDWPQREWVKAFPEQRDLLGRMDNPLSRADVREAVSNLPRTDDGAVGAFVACMAWGYGRTGYGRSRTRNVLDSNRDAPRKLAKARAIASKGDLRSAFDAYEYLAGKGRLEHLGPAFGTKFIHFHNIEGLILDKLTAEWYERACGIDLKSTQWNPGKYREYLAFMGGWAESLGIRPDQLEEIAFSQVSRERGNQWA